MYNPTTVREGEIRKTQVSDQMTRLGSRLESLRDVVIQLEERLSLTVLRSDETAKELEPEEKAQVMVPLATQLDLQVRAVGEIIRRMEDIQRRLEL